MAFPIINPATLGGARKDNTKECPKCNGNGYLGKLKWSGTVICPMCKGKGYL